MSTSIGYLFLKDSFEVKNDDKVEESEEKEEEEDDHSLPNKPEIKRK